MRTYTDNERTALTIALRTYIRDMSGKRMEEKRARKALASALDAGIDLDTLFNPQNFLRLKATIDDPSVEDYIEAVREYRIDARPLKKEPDWNSNGFETVARVYHDFYCHFDTKGGVWNTPIALSNLAKLIEKYSFAAILSEKSLKAVMDSGKTTVYTYVTSLLSRPEDFPVEMEPTEEEQLRIDEEGKMAADSYDETKLTSLAEIEESEASGETEKNAEEEASHEEAVNRFLRNLTDGPDEENEDLYPAHDKYAAVFGALADSPASDESNEEEIIEDETGGTYDEMYDPMVSYSVRPNPYLLKRNAVEDALKELTLAEINGLASTMDDGQFLKLTEIIDKLTAGKFDTSRERVETRQTHMLLSSMLVQQFIDCCRMNGVEMDEEKAAGYDILKSEWDLRNPRTRTFYKLRELILQKGEADEDLLKAIPELEKVFDPDLKD